MSFIKFLTALALVPSDKPRAQSSSAFGISNAYTDAEVTLEILALLFDVESDFVVHVFENAATQVTKKLAG